jgi:molecular chaperone DnaJ
VRYQQGFFVVARTCGQCGGTGSVIKDPCKACRGNGHVTRERKLTVKIPPGIASGQRLRLYGEGEAGAMGGPPGDLYVVIGVKSHEFFKRDGDDLFCEVAVNFPTLVLGGDITVQTLEAEETLKIPEGTSTGRIFHLRHKGMPSVSGRGRGDLHVMVQARTPRKLTKEQRAALDKLAKLLPAEKAEFRSHSEPDNDDRGVFDRVKDLFS